MSTEELLCSPGETRHTDPETLSEWVTAVKEKLLLSFHHYRFLIRPEVILLTVHFCMNLKANPIKKILI